MTDDGASRLQGECRSGLQPPGGPARRLPSLDGLRAISIALVICAHAVGTNTFGARFSHWRLVALGALGVNVFFVVSGYLITHLLLQESGSIGAISLKNFYVRRALRICPAFYAYVVVMALASLAGLIAIAPGDFISALTYTMNCRGSASWYVGHLWSLSVEAQFYLVWPLILAFLGRSRAVRALISLLVALPLMRAAILYFLPTQEHLVFVVFREGFDALAIGCLFACIGRWLDARAGYLRFLQSPAMLLAPACIVLTQALGPSHLVLSVSISQAIKNIAIGLCLEHCVRYPQDFAGRVLNSRALVFVGVLSYSLYLWQQPFLNRTSDSVIASFPQNVALSVLAAAASYYLIERPFLKLRKLFRRQATLFSSIGQNRLKRHAEMAEADGQMGLNMRILQPACAPGLPDVGGDEETVIQRDIGF